MNNKFKKGLLLGGLLAAAAVLGFSMTKKGQQLSAELEDALKELTLDVKNRLAELEDVTKEKFDELVATVAAEYAEKKALAVDAKDALVAALQEKWTEMEDAYLNHK